MCLAIGAEAAASVTFEKLTGTEASLRQHNLDQVLRVYSESAAIAKFRVILSFR